MKEENSLTMAERLCRLEKFIDEGRLVRNHWGFVKDGLEYGSLLSALSPEARDSEDEYSCPAAVMPQSLACLTLWMNYAVSDAAWPDMVRRYAAVSSQWHVISDKTWERLRYEWTLIVLREARSYATGADLVATDAVMALCERATSGDLPDISEWLTAEEQAENASSYMYTRRTPAEAAASSYEWAAAEAAEMAMEAAEDPPSAADRIAFGILSSIERECAE